MLVSVRLWLLPPSRITTVCPTVYFVPDPSATVTIVAVVPAAAARVSPPSFTVTVPASATSLTETNACGLTCLRS